MTENIRFMTASLKDELDRRFRENIEYFKKKGFISLLPFEHYRAKKSLYFFCLDNGVVNLEIGGEILYPAENPYEYTQNQVAEFIADKKESYTSYAKEHDFYGHIHYRYLNECADLLSNFLKEHENNVYDGVPTVAHTLMLGLGLGYALECYVSNIETAHISIIEPDDDLLYASLFVTDYTSLFEFFISNNINVNIIHGQEINSLLDRLYNNLSVHGKFLAGFSRAFVHYGTKEIRDIASYLVGGFKNIYAMMGFYDDHLFGISHGIHSLMDKVGYILNKKLTHADKTPVFIVGNGPSLDNDLPFLRKNQDKAIIVAAGSAIDTLYGAGIQCDFYTAIERTNDITQILQHMQKQYFDNVILLGTDVVNPVSYRFFKNSALFMKNDEPFYELLQRHCNSIDLKDLSSVTFVNPLVSNLALSAVLELGFKKIYLFGIDNGKKTVYSTVHSKASSAYAGEYYGQIEFDTVYRSDSIIDGNFGGSVESNYLYKKSIYNLENTLRLYMRRGNAFVCTNCSDGALIQGTESKKSCDLDFDSLENIDKTALISDFLRHNVRHYELTGKDIALMLDKDGFKDSVHRLLAVIKESSYQDRAQALKLLTRLAFTLHELRSGCSDTARLMDGSLQYFSICMSQALFAVKCEKEAIGLFNKMLERFCYFLEDAIKLYDYMPDYIENEHLKLLNGHLGFDHENSKAPDCIMNYELEYKGHGVDAFIKRYI